VAQPKKGLTAQIALSLLKKAVEAEQRNPKVAAAITALKHEIHASFEKLRAELERCDERDRHLLTVPLINFIHDKADEILVE